MGVTKDNKFNFYDVELISTNKSGKFYFEVVKNKSKVYEVDVDLFKTMLVSAANVKTPKTAANSLDYLLSQIEMTEDIFTALLYPDWINEYIE